MDDDFKEKDREIKRLKDEVTGQKDEIANLIRQLQDKKHSDQLGNENKRLVETIRNLEKKNEEMRRELSSLKNDIERLSDQPKMGKQF